MVAVAFEKSFLGGSLALNKDSNRMFFLFFFFGYSVVRQQSASVEHNGVRNKKNPSVPLTLVYFNTLTQMVVFGVERSRFVSAKTHFSTQAVLLPFYV